MERWNKMKKILFSLLSFFLLTTMVKALDIKNTQIEYYVKESQNSIVYNVYKPYVESPENVVFIKNYKEFVGGMGFTESSSYDEYYGALDGSVNSIFADASYYGYNVNPSDENYFYTQFYIWKYIFNKDIVMCDKQGTLIKEEDIPFFQNLKEKIAHHRLEENFFKEKKKGEIWNDTYFYFSNQEEYILPASKGLELESLAGGFKIKNKEIGNYNLAFTTSLKPEVKWYHWDGDYTYLRNTGGPSDLAKNLQYEVYGTPFQIKEEIKGVNGKYGDALEQSNVYSLYLIWEEKLNMLPNKEYQIKSNSHYTVKDALKQEAYKELEDISFDLDDEENYVLTIKREVIKAQINFDIKDNNTYQIILKSNNEIYETIDKETKEVTLPYGTYLIKGVNTDYEKEIKVLDENPLKVEINNPFNNGEVADSSQENMEDDKDNTLLENIPQNSNDEIDWSKVPNKDFLNETNLDFWPPKTNDNILIYAYLLMSFSIIALISFRKINKLTREGL